MMMRNNPVATARALRAVCILMAALGAATVAVAAPGTATAVTAGASSTTPVVAPHQNKISPKPTTAFAWTDLTPAQQQALAPLAGEWNKLEVTRKKKWLEIGEKFSSKTPDEQQRIQERMREWIKLTPEQKRVARENYSRTKKLSPDKKSAQWEQYQQLPEDEKKKLANDAASKKHVANPPPAHSKNTTVPPIKSTHKPILEQSATPQAAHPADVQPATPPVTK